MELKRLDDQGTLVLWNRVKSYINGITSNIDNTKMDKVNPTGSGTLNIDGSIIAKNHLFSGGKTGYNDGLPGVEMGNNGRIYATGINSTPGILLYGEGQTEAGASIMYNPTGDELSFNFASRYKIGGMYYGEYKELWTGTDLMPAATTIELGEAVSAQPNGIVLVWSYYENGAAVDQYFNYVYIPKYHVQKHESKGVASLIVGTANGDSRVTQKYVYVSDSTIKGYIYNSATSDSTNPEAAKQTGTDIIIKPGAFCLRKVLGV